VRHVSAQRQARLAKSRGEEIIKRIARVGLYGKEKEGRSREEKKERKRRKETGERIQKRIAKRRRINPFFL
jgi:hypothetical protein